MDYFQAIDLIFKPVPTDEINGKSRMDILLYVFTELKTVNFTMADLDEKTTNYIADKLKSKLVHEMLDFLQNYYILCEIREAAKMHLDREVKKVEPKAVVEPIRLVEPVKVEVTQDDYNPESDVLDEEGLMEPPPARKMQYDLEFMKSLGITPDE
jgi:hypothetical protein